MPRNLITGHDIHRLLQIAGRLNAGIQLQCT